MEDGTDNWNTQALARKSFKTSNVPPASNVLLKGRSRLCLMDYVAKIALPRYAMDRVFPELQYDIVSI